MTILALDLGGTQIKAALLSEDLEFKQTFQPQGTPQSLEAFLDYLDQMLTPYLKEVSGIAISAPGTIDTDQGIIYHGGLLPYLHGFKVRQVLETKYQKPVVALNDGKAAVLAELVKGNLKGVTNGVALVLGSGLGGGLVLNGQLYQGSHFQAGELTFLWPYGQERMSPEQIRGQDLSAVSLIKAINQSLGHTDLKDGRLAFQALLDGHFEVYPLFESYCRRLAITILNLQTTLDVERFVIGGGISAQALLIQEINRQFDKVHQEIDFIGRIIKRPEILACAYQNGANLLGAACFLNANEELIR